MRRHLRMIEPGQAIAQFTLPTSCRLTYVNEEIMLELVRQEDATAEPHAGGCFRCACYRARPCSAVLSHISGSLLHLLAHQCSLTTAASV